MENLKPCPFCGDKVHIQYESDIKAFTVWHYGIKCKFIEPFCISGSDAKSLNEAYKVWNERAETTIVNNGTMNITM